MLYSIHRVTVTHLHSFEFNHSPMLHKVVVSTPRVPKAFKFQVFWTSHTEFQSVVSKAWDKFQHLFLLISIARKLKSTSIALSAWIKVTSEDIFQAIRDAVAKVTFCQEGL